MRADVKIIYSLKYQQKKKKRETYISLSFKPIPGSMNATSSEISSLNFSSIVSVLDLDTLSFSLMTREFLFQQQRRN